MRISEICGWTMPARRSSKRSENPPKIKDVAARVGYSSASQFSRDYKEQHGETPLCTMQSPQ